MIKQLHRYIIKHIFYATLITASVVSVVLFILTFLGEAKNIGEGNYHLGQALFYVIMRLPGLIYQFEPIFILLGSIVGLSLLVAYREMMSMRVSGFSTRQIIYSVLSAALVLIMVISVLGEWAAPPLSAIAELHKENSRNAGKTLRTEQGVWFHVQNNFIRIEHVMNHEFLTGITRYQFDKSHHLAVVYAADYLVLQNQTWTMHNVTATHFFDDHVDTQSFQQLPWGIKWNVSFLNRDIKDLSELSLFKLATVMHYLEKNGLQSKDYQYEFWQRVFQPLVSLMMVLIAIPLMLNALPVAAMGVRILIGMASGMLFFIFNAFLGQICVVYQVHALLAASLPLLLLTITIMGGILWRSIHIKKS